MSGLILLLATAFVAEPTLRLEPAEVELGRPFVLHVEPPAGTSARYELPLHPRLDGVHVLGVERQGDGLKLSLQITSALGEVELPELPLHVLQDGRVETIRVRPPPLRVRSTVAEGEDELAQPVPPMEIRERSFVPAFVAGGALALALLGFVGIRKLRALRALVPEAERPAHERALAALDALQKEELLAAGRGREFYFRLSAIVRRYLTQTTDLPASDLTSEELCTLLGRRERPPVDVESFSAWLRRGDRVRYAKAQAEREAALADLEQARGFLRPPAEEEEAA